MFPLFLISFSEDKAGLGVRMGFYVSVGKGFETLFIEKLITHFFKEDFERLLKLAGEVYKKSFPMLFEVLRTCGRCRISSAQKLLEEALDLLKLLAKEEDRFPQFFFIVTFPKDFDDILSALLGGSLSIEIPSDEGFSYEVKGGLGGAALYKKVNGGISYVKKLDGGDVVSIGKVSMKVFTKSCYQAFNKPLKTLITASLIAERYGGEVDITETTTISGEGAFHA